MQTSRPRLSSFGETALFSLYTSSRNGLQKSPHFSPRLFRYLASETGYAIFATWEFLTLRRSLFLSVSLSLFLTHTHSLSPNASNRPGSFSALFSFLPGSSARWLDSGVRSKPRRLRVPRWMGGRREGEPHRPGPFSSPSVALFFPVCTPLSRVVVAVVLWAHLIGDGRRSGFSPAQGR